MKKAKPESVDASDCVGTTTRRRLVVMSVASLAVGLSATFPKLALAQAKKGASDAKAQETGTKSPNQALIAAVKRCETVGNICLRHCIRLTKAGDKSIADCMRSVQVMLPVCGVVSCLATLDARRLKDLAKVCMDICSDCESECRKHEFHHVECKNCAEACAATVQALKTYIAA